MNDHHQVKIRPTSNDAPNPAAHSTQSRSARLIEEALRSLTMEEREKVQKDLAGVDSLATTTNSSRMDAKTEEFQQHCLTQLERELSRLRTASSWSLQLAALEMAEQQNLSYVQNPKFRLRFLQIEGWDASKAATRFIRYFDFKLELFGEDSLTKEITLSDLEPGDLKMLKRGYAQLLPSRDHGGRAVLCAIYNGQVYESPASMARIFWYLVNTRDKECDNCGVIVVVFKIAFVKFVNNGVVLSSMVVQRLIESIPVRWCAMHKLVGVGESGYSQMERLFDATMNLFRPNIRARIRIYKGSHTEWIYKIMTLGIPHELIPLMADYKIKTKHLSDWLSMRKKMEEFAASPASSKIETTDLPTNFDVLLGKGKPIQNSCGNQRLSGLIDNHLEQYYQSSRTEKTTLANEIVAKVQAYGGQFLSKESGVWIAVSDDMARDKVSHMIRHQLQRGNKRAQELTGNCNTVRSSRQRRTDELDDADIGMSKRIRT